MLFAVNKACCDLEKNNNILFAPLSNCNVPLSLGVNWSHPGHMMLYARLPMCECLHDSFAMSDTSATFQPYLRGFSQLKCFQDQLLVAIFRCCATHGAAETQLVRR